MIMTSCKLCSIQLILEKMNAKTIRRVIFLTSAPFGPCGPLGPGGPGGPYKKTKIN